MILFFKNHILLYQNDSVFSEPYSALSEWFCFSRTKFCFIRIIFYAHLTQPYKIQYIGWIKCVAKMILFFQNHILLYQNDYVFPEPHSAISESFSRGISYLIIQWIITEEGIWNFRKHYPFWLIVDYPIIWLSKMVIQND